MAHNPLDGLTRAAPGLKLSTDGDLLGEYGRDWTRLHQPAPAAVAFPRNIEEVVAIVDFANSHSFALVPSGGRTGLSGGAMASSGELVVSLQGMNAIGDFDPVDRTVTVQAGVITQQLQEFAESQGLMFPVDFASKGSSQIGGNLATNAGGIRVLRYGLMRDWVTGLKVVTGRGDVLDLNRGLIKNASGYDLRHLFVGSEGTLGIIVEATMKLTAKPPTQSVMLLAATDMSAVMRIFGEARARLTLSAFEFFSDLALDKVLERTEHRQPFEERAPFYALAEFDCAGEEHEAAALECFESCAEQELVLDGVISQSDTQAADLWALRENISESISHHTPYKNDISVRVSEAPRFLKELDALVEKHYPQFEVVWFGHIGDGNLHLNILKPEDLSVDEFARSCESVNDVVYGLVERFGGSISAEHGVGLIKKPYLCHSRSAAELEYLRGIKKVFDPTGIMNPGKLIDG
jgi:glycolate oxidase subunit GlcD